MLDGYKLPSDCRLDLHEAPWHRIVLQDFEGVAHQKGFSRHRRTNISWVLSVLVQELTPRAQDSLVSFGERLSTRLFAAYLRAQGVPAQQHDAFDIGAPRHAHVGCPT